MTRRLDAQGRCGNFHSSKNYEKNPRSILNILVSGLERHCSWRRRSGKDSTEPNADSFTSGPTVDTSSAIVQLKGDPLSTYSKTKPARGKKIDFNGNTVKSYRAQLNAGRNEFKRWLRANAPRAKVTQSSTISHLTRSRCNSTGRRWRRSQPRQWCRATEYNALYYPNLSESYKIINASDAWTAAGGRATAGAGIKIGDIDTRDRRDARILRSDRIQLSAWVSRSATRPTAQRITRIENCKYVTEKVIVAKVFYNKARQQGLDAQAIDDHGTHTAGIAAGVTGKTAVVNGVRSMTCPASRRAHGWAITMFSPATLQRPQRRHP